MQEAGADMCRNVSKSVLTRDRVVGQAAAGWGRKPWAAACGGPAATNTEGVCGGSDDWTAGTMNTGVCVCGRCCC